MKKFWLLLMAMIMSIALAACGANGSEDGAKSKGDKEGEKESTAVEENSNDDMEESQVEEENSNDTEENSQGKEKISEDVLYAEAFKEDILILSENMLELTQESYDFIVSNHTLFPAKTDEAIAEVKGQADTSLTIKHLNKNPQPYFQTMTTFQGYVVSVEEESLGNGETVAIVHVLDDDLNSYQLLIYKSTGDILEEDNVQFWGLPVGGSSFENVSGGTTNVQNFFGAHIEKVNL